MHQPRAALRRPGLTRRKARARLFAALALASFILIQQPFLARLAYRVVGAMGPRFDQAASIAWIIVEDRWLLAACVLVAIYYAWRLAAAPPGTG